MAVEIKSLNADPPLLNETIGSVDLAATLLNTIPVKDAVYDLYTAPITGGNKATIVKSIRLINTHAKSVLVSLYFDRPHEGQHRRRLITPDRMLLLPNLVYIDDVELTLEPGDMIQGKAVLKAAAEPSDDKNPVVQYLLSGVERGVS